MPFGLYGVFVPVVRELLGAVRWNTVKYVPLWYILYVFEYYKIRRSERHKKRHNLSFERHIMPRLILEF